MTDGHPDQDGAASADDAPVRPAATVVVLRDAVHAASAGLEVLMLRRNSKLAFYGGAWVFPGGRIDPEDCLDGDRLDHIGAAVRAGVRETFEEAGLTLPVAELVHFAQWLTPPGRTRRFDTWFFAARAARGQGVGPRASGIQVDQGEIDAHRWLSPAAALAAHGRGEIELPPPTFVTLSQLKPFVSAESAYDSLAQGAVQRFAPRPIQTEETLVFLYEEDAGYPERNPHAEGPRHRITVRGHQWHYEQPERTEDPTRS